MREPFAQRALEMGLQEIGAHKGCYVYSDRYSEIAYRQLYTGMINISEDDRHPTDGIPVPNIGIFTRPTDDVDFVYVGTVSDFYQFIGNDILCEKVRESIQSIGLPIVTENAIMSYDHTRLRNEIVIQSSQSHPQAGDVLPVMVVNNSYNGTRAAAISFGIAMDYDGPDRKIFAFSLGEMRQVHIQNAQTEMRSHVTTYMTAFSENILDIITNSFSNRVTETEMLSVLDIIEKYGKKRRDAISKILEEIQPASFGPPSSWQLFLAIVRYSSFEPNLNIKKLLENAAESVLVIPPRMYKVLEELQT